MKDKIYSLKCTSSDCQTRVAFSFEPFPVDTQPVYCIQCIRMITQFPSKFSVKRFNDEDIRVPWDYRHPHALFKFLKTNYYEENKGRPNALFQLETPIKPKQV